MTQRNGIRGLTAIVAATVVLAAACGADGNDRETGPAATAAGGPTTVPAGGGWIDGEPEWYQAGALAAGDEALEAPAEFDAATVDDVGGGAAVLTEGDGRGGEEVRPLPPDIEPPDPGQPLRAGSVDDNADYEGFLAYLARLADIGIRLRPLDASNRSVVTVTGADGLPRAGAEVVATSGDISVTLRTTADGTVRFHPGFYGMDAAAGITFATDGADAVVVGAGEDAALTTTGDGGATAPVPLDVLFLLDATGSMGDEIDRLKATIDSVAGRVAALDPAPDVRFAMTLYRDEGDAFVTASFDFTADVAQFKAALGDVVADGGGDYPEALDEGLAEALAAPSWRPAGEAVQLVFLVADAPPQIGRQVPTTYADSVRTAIERGIKIFPVASSESDDQAEAVFRQLAQATGAPFVFLSYGAGGAATGGNTDIDSTDYEELALDELVVRLIAEELSDLGGDDPITVPTTSAPPTTNPDGQ